MNIVLAPLAHHHLSAMRTWINDPRVAEPFLFDRQLTDSEHLAWFDRVVVDTSQKLFAVLSSGEHVGVVGLKSIDFAERKGEIWIYLAPAAQGIGIGSNAVAIATKFAFEQLRLDLLSLIVRADNPKARRIYQKLGFTESGFHKTDTRFQDIVVVQMTLGERQWRQRMGRGPKVALMQPTFLPWLGFFELMDVVDIFIVLDDFQFTRHSWAHRNRLMFAGKPQFVNLPIRHPGSLDATFLEIQDADSDRWRRKLALGVEQNYRHAPQYHAVKPIVDAWLAERPGDIASLEVDWIDRFRRHLNIDCILRRSSEFSTRHLRRSERVLALLEAVEASVYYAASGAFEYMKQDGVFPERGPEVLFQDHIPTPYVQLNVTDFVPNLSALDAAFNLDRAQFRSVLRGTRQWLPWDFQAAKSLQK